MIKGQSGYWFTKFYEGGGIPFTSIKPETEFVEIRFSDKDKQLCPIEVKITS